MAFRFIDAETGEELPVVTFTDCHMIEVEEDDAFYAIVRRPDGELEAFEILRRPTLH